VKLAQLLLDSHGYQLGADGAFGPLTRASVVSFQRSRGLAADGVVGVHTWAALGS
jgi:peptidoglycan hydrolase-like protein with peptidoglycan-binding domain